VNKLITGIMVTYNTKDLVRRAYESVRAFHSTMRIIIVDGSEVGNPCYEYVGSLASEYTDVIQVDYNIGHGRGMCVGIYYTETPYVLLLDSDIEMLRTPVKEMLAMMEKDTFGIGYLEKTGFDGFNYGAKPNHSKEGWMWYLHPYFTLIQLSVYKKFYPFVHHGAPCVWTMLDIHKKGLSKKILKEFLGLGHTNGRGVTWEGKPSLYVKHDTAGTRKYRKSNNLPEIEGVWEKNKGQI